MNNAQLPRAMTCDRASRRLRIAMVYSRIPFPMMRGDQMTVAHLISFLAARGHTVDLYTLDADGALEPLQRRWLYDSCRSVRIYRQPWYRKLIGLVLGSLKLVPIQVSIFRNPDLTRDLRQAVDRDDYDIVYCYYLRSAPAVPKSIKNRTSTASFLALQLSQTLNTHRMAQNEPIAVKRAIYRVEAALMGRFEASVWRNFDRVVLIGPADVDAVKEQCRKRNKPVIDNWIYGAHGTDTDKFVPAKPEEIVRNRVIFSGSMIYPPNIQAVLWFVDKVWPVVRQQIPDAQLVIQGRDPAPTIRRLDGKDGIWVTGTVPDVGVLIRSAQVCINPMLAAGGMQNKLIEYMACRKAVVASSVANEGIRAPSDAVLIADDPADFAEAVVGLLTHPDRAEQLGSTARRYVLSQWTWEKHFLDLEGAFYSALDTFKNATPPRSTEPTA